MNPANANAMQTNSTAAMTNLTSTRILAHSHASYRNALVRSLTGIALVANANAIKTKLIAKAISPSTKTLASASATDQDMLALQTSRSSTMKVANVYAITASLTAVILLLTLMRMRACAAAT